MLRLAYEKEVNNLIEQLMQQHTKHLLRLAYFYTKNHQVAEDIVQEVFIQFYHADYEDIGKERAYLSKMTINKCKDYFRSWHYKKMQFNTFLEDKGIKTKDKLVIQEEKLTIGEAILSLKITYREPIILYYFEEYTLNEIAQILQLPINTVKTRLRRAKELLKPLLEDEWEVLVDATN